MSEYIIFTDSACDIKPELLQQWSVHFANMTFTFEEEEREYTSTDIPLDEFYNRMRQGPMRRRRQSMQTPLCVRSSQSFRKEKISYILLSPPDSAPQ